MRFMCELYLIHGVLLGRRKPWTPSTATTRILTDPGGTSWTSSGGPAHLVCYHTHPYALTIHIIMHYQQQPFCT